MGEQDERCLCAHKSSQAGWGYRVSLLRGAVGRAPHSVTHSLTHAITQEEKGSPERARPSSGPRGAQTGRAWGAERGRGADLPRLAPGWALHDPRPPGHPQERKGKGGERRRASRAAGRWGFPPASGRGTRTSGSPPGGPLPPLQEAQAPPPARGTHVGTSPLPAGPCRTHSPTHPPSLLLQPPGRCLPSIHPSMQCARGQPFPRPSPRTLNPCPKVASGCPGSSSHSGTPAGSPKSPCPSPSPHPRPLGVRALRALARCTSTCPAIWDLPAPRLLSCGGPRPCTPLHPKIRVHPITTS